MRKMVMNETAAAYGVVVLLILFAMLTSCAGPTRISSGYHANNHYHHTPARANANACGYWGR